MAGTLLPSNESGFERLIARSPWAVRVIWSIWMRFGKTMGMVMSWIILTILWIVGFGAYGIVLRVASLVSPRSARGDSYWISVPPVKIDSYRRQF